MNCEPMFINSALVSAQNRQRYYWFNWDALIPEDRGVVLSDILENGFVDRDKSYCIDANYHKGGNLKSYAKGRRQLVFGKTPSMTSSSWHHNLKIKKEGDFEYRLLTVKECETLQGLPKGYTSGVSNTQAYKMLGNGWQGDTIEHLFTYMPWRETQ
jgi:hypothetical protein